MGFRRLKIHGFKGLDTQKGDFHGDASVSPDAVNFICADGVMKTAGGTREYAERLPVKKQAITRRPVKRRPLPIRRPLR